MNNFTCIARLGKDPEVIKLGEREGRKLRAVDATYGKKAVDRWFTAIVTGPDVATADRLKKGDQVMITGALIQEEYAPKKPRFKGEMIKDDVIPYAKLLQVVKSPSFFNQEGDEGEKSDAAADQGTTTDAPDLSDSPLAGIA